MEECEGEQTQATGRSAAAVHSLAPAPSMKAHCCVPARCVCAQCADKLRVRPEPSTLSACPKFPKDMKAKAKGKITAIKDSHKGETCVLIANGPSLNKIRWDWQDNFNVVMGMNKIFLGLERYNISKMTHCERRPYRSRC